TAAPPAPSEAAPPAALPVPARPAIAVPAVAIGPAAVAAPMTGAAIGPRVASAAMIAPEMAEAAVSMVVPLSLRVGPATGRSSADVKLLRKDRGLWHDGRATSEVDRDPLRCGCRGRSGSRSGCRSGS